MLFLLTKESKGFKISGIPNKNKPTMIHLCNMTYNIIRSNMIREVINSLQIVGMMYLYTNTSKTISNNFFKG